MDVHRSFGDDICNIVSGERVSTIEALATFAGESAELRESLLRKIETAPLSDLGEASILLLARERRACAFLKTKLFEIMMHDEHNWYAVGNRLTAVDVLGREFHDLGVANILADLATRNNIEALIGLCDWWPEHDFVRRLSMEQQTRIHRYRPALAMSIAVATYEPSDMINFAARQFGEFHGEIWEFHPRTTDALVRRMLRDQPLRDGAIARLRTGMSPDEKASWPGILRRAGALTATVREECAREIDRQRRIVMPEFGMDVNVGWIRSVRRAILDVIGPR